MPDLPEKVISLSRAIRDAGGRALLVGGCVRDTLMGKEPKDWDLEVYNLEPERLRSLLDQFGSVNVVGESFTVYKLGRHLDVSIPRRERKSGRGHKAFIIEGDPSMSVAEATRRRDFTINAILQDPLTAEIIDPFDGRRDIERRTLLKAGLAIGAAQFASPFVSRAAAAKKYDTGATDSQIMADRLEAGTLLMACGIAGGEIELVGTRLEHLEIVAMKLCEMGMRVSPTPEGRVVAAQLWTMFGEPEKAARVKIR